jgi:acyl-CoA thioester hydrolase
VSAPFRYYFRVRYGECDAQHVVFNAKYGEYFDMAATEFLRAAVAPADPFDGTFEWQVAKLLVEWKSSARFDDVIEVAVRCVKLGTTSFTLGFELRKAGAPGVLVTGETVNVHVDKATWAKRPMSEAMRTLLMTGAAGKQTDHAGYLT